MKIEFTREQYKNLMKAVCVCNHIANCPRKVKRKMVMGLASEFQGLQNHVLSHALKFGLNVPSEKERKGTCLDAKHIKSELDLIEGMLLCYPDMLFGEIDKGFGVFEIVNGFAKFLHSNRMLISTKNPSKRLKKFLKKK